MARLPAVAATTEPTRAAPRHPSTSGRLPYMSPMRPTIGLNAAPMTSVDVATHDTAAMLASKASGRAGSSGIELVCTSAITAMANAIDATTRTE